MQNNIYKGISELISEVDESMITINTIIHKPTSRSMVANAGSALRYLLLIYFLLISTNVRIKHIMQMKLIIITPRRINEVAISNGTGANPSGNNRTMIRAII